MIWTCLLAGHLPLLLAASSIDLSGVLTAILGVAGVMLWYFFQRHTSRQDKTIEEQNKTIESLRAANKSQEDQGKETLHQLDLLRQELSFTQQIEESRRGWEDVKEELAQIAKEPSERMAAIEEWREKLDLVEISALGERLKDLQKIWGDHLALTTELSKRELQDVREAAQKRFEGALRSLREEVRRLVSEEIERQVGGEE